MKLRPEERIWTVREGEMEGLVLLPPGWSPPKSADGVIDRQRIVLKRLVEESIEEYGGPEKLRSIEADFRERLDWRQLDDPWTQMWLTCSMNAVTYPHLRELEKWYPTEGVLGGEENLLAAEYLEIGEFVEMLTSVSPDYYY